MECDKCLKDFNKAARTPKNAPCGHTVCLHCLEQSDRRECPTCRRVFSPVPSDLPTNLTVLRLVEREDENRVLRGWCTNCRAAATRQCWEEHDVLSTKAALRRYLPADELEQAAGQLGSLRHEIQEDEMLLKLLTAESWNLTLRDGCSVLKGTVTNAKNPVTKAMWLLVAAQAGLNELACPPSSLAKALESLEQLPDAVLLLVMQHLDVQSIFTCRLMCKRLATLALHPDVWRHRTLSNDDPNAAAVLYLAPCLNWVDAESRALALQMTTTRCAVAELHLNLKPDDQTSWLPAELALLIRNQEALGRLRSLVLYCEVGEEDVANDEAKEVLLRTLAQCSGLVSLKIGELPGATTHPAERGPPRASLKCFHCPRDCVSSQSFINTILVSHAATLEEVDLRWGEFDDDTDTTARLLGALPNLQKLICLKMPGIETVAACAKLRYFSIGIADYVSVDDAKDLAKFIRRARQLKQLELEDSAVSPEVEALALEALTESGKSNVEELVLSVQNVRLLSDRLHKLPALRHLCVAQQAELDYGLLRSITPVTAPNLRLLELKSNDGVCTHEWLHRGAVKTVLAVNPSLHIVFRDCHKCCHEDCEACSGDCHREVPRGKGNTVGLYSHDKKNCTSAEYHSTDIKLWIHTASIRI